MSAFELPADEIRIETLADLMTVPRAKRADLLEDLWIWMGLMDSAEEIGAGSFLPVMIWKDDGLREIRGAYINGEFIAATPRGESA